VRKTWLNMVGVGFAVVAIGGIPPTLVEYSRSAGAIGTVSRAATWASVSAVLVLFGGLAAMLMKRALSPVLGQTPILTAWVSAIPGLTIWWLGGLTTPLLLALWHLGDELKGADDAGLGLFGVWVALLLLFGSLGTTVSAVAFTWCNRGLAATER
jgi:hypothetical protein